MTNYLFVILFGIGIYIFISAILIIKMIIRWIFLSFNGEELPKFNYAIKYTLTSKNAIKLALSATIIALGIISIKNVLPDNVRFFSSIICLALIYLYVKIDQ